MLEDYLNTGIKEVISRFPDVAAILEEYDIGCAPCSVGSCLLKDIVKIHHLSEEDERALMARIAGVVDPSRPLTTPASPRSRPAQPQDIGYSPPLRKLVDEHAWIKRLLALLPWVVETLEVQSTEGRQLVLRTLDFIRSYADQYHHAKEEDILFRYFEENLEILKAMREEHEKARSHVRAVRYALERGNWEEIVAHLNAYRELLSEHIRKEDEILYRWMDRTLSFTQGGGLFSQFTAAEEKIDQDVIEGCRKFIVELEEQAWDSNRRKAVP